MNYIYSNELYHHGIKGQKWGVRRWQNTDGSLTPEGYPHYGYNGPKNKKSNNSDLRKKLDALNKENDLAREEHNTKIKAARDRGISVAELEDEQKKSKFQLTDKQKKVIKIGLVAAGTALAAYGAYKILGETGVLNQFQIDDDNGPDYDEYYHKIRDLEASRVALGSSEFRKSSDVIDKSLVGQFIDSNTLITGSDIYGENGTIAHTDKGTKAFIQRSFDDKSNYYVFDESHKAAVNDLLTPSSGEWWSNLTSDEKKAIEAYTGFYYGPVNSLLWKAKGDDLKKHDLVHIAAATENARSALKKASFPVDMVTSHGVSVERACQFLGCTQEELITAAQNPSNNKLLNQVNIQYGMLSASSCAGADSGFPGVKYRVYTPKGAHAAFVEHISRTGDLPHPPLWDGKEVGGPPFSSEFETLFADGSKFKTKGIGFTDEGKIEIAIEYLIDD